MRRWLLVIAGLLLTVVGVVLVRTWTFAAPDYASDLPTPPAAPAFVVAESAARLGAAIRFPTVSQQVDANAAIDRSAWAALHAWLEQSYPRAHTAMERHLIADWTLLYRWPGSDPTLPPIVLMAHQDVVPVTPGTEGDWRQPPFAGVLAGDAVWGRGAIDDKGSLVALFESIEALLADGFVPRRSVILLSGHDEEVGGTGARAAAEWMAGRGLRAAFVLDEGMVTVTDFPLLKAPVALIGVAEKGYGTLRVRADAAGGHSSMPPARTAVGTLARALVAMDEQQDPLSLDGPAFETLAAVAPRAGFTTRMAIANRWLFSPLLKAQIATTPSGAALLHTTMAPTMLSGSPKENVLAQRAEALVNFRIAPGQTPDDVLARARAAVAHLEVQLEWVGSPKPPSAVSPTDSEGWRQLAVLAAGEHAHPVAPALVLAGTDSYHLAPVADAVFRHQPLELSLSELTMIHGTNEHLTLANLERMLRFYARLIRATAG